MVLCKTLVGIRPGVRVPRCDEHFPRTMLEGDRASFISSVEWDAYFCLLTDSALVQFTAELLTQLLNSSSDSFRPRR